MTASRTDANQREIVAALRDCGATVHCTHEAAHGFPDLVVGHRGVNYLFEVKSAGGKLTADQYEFHANWRGQVCVIRCVEDALIAIGVMENRTILQQGG